MIVIKIFNRMLAIALYVHLAVGGLLNILPYLCEFKTAGESLAIGILALIGIFCVFVEICTERRNDG